MACQSRPRSISPRENVDLIIVATFAPADELIRALMEQGIPREKIVPLRGTEQ